MKEKNINTKNCENPEEVTNQIFNSENVEDIKNFVRNKTESRQKIKKSERDKKKKKTIKLKKIVRADDIDKIYYNSFDRFFIKIWASICAFVSGTAKLIYKSLRYAFRISIPLKYLKVLISIILIAIIYIICILPFLVPILKNQKEPEKKSAQIEQNEEVSKFLNSYKTKNRKYSINIANQIFNKYINKNKL